MSYADVNGLHMYYETHGSGRPLVLIHGGLGSSSMFGPNLPALAKGRRVIAPDLQGHGRTPTSTGRCTRRRWPATSSRSSSS